MKIKECWTLLPLLLSVAIVGCGSKEIKESEFTGFLSSYEGLEHNEELNAYRRVDPSIKNYNKIILNPVGVVLDENELDSETITKNMTAYLGGGLFKELDEAGVLADEPSVTTLRMRAAVTGAQKAEESMKAYQVIPIAAIYQGVKAIAGTRDAYIDTYLEIELVDSVTGKQIAAAVLRSAGETEKLSGDAFAYEDTIPVMDSWLQRFNRFLTGSLPTINQ